MPLNTNADAEKWRREPEGYTPFTQPELLYKPLRNEPKEFINSGNRENLPQYNSTEMSIIDYYRSNPYLQEELTGNGIGKFFKRLGKDIKKTAIQSGDAIKESATKKNGVIRNLISNTLDVVAPVAGEVLAPMVGMDPMTGKMVAELGRKTLKSQTGYGVAGVGTYKGGGIKKDKAKIETAVKQELNKAIQQFLPEAKECMGSGIESKPEPKKEAKSKAVNTNRSDRNAIVKKIMQERKVSLPEASKIVKAEGLYKK